MRPRARIQAPSAKCHASYRGDTYRQESGLGALAMEVSIHAHMPVRASTRYFGTSGAMYEVHDHRYRLRRTHRSIVSCSGSGASATAPVAPTSRQRVSSLRISYCTLLMTLLNGDGGANTLGREHCTSSQSHLPGRARLVRESLSPRASVASIASTACIACLAGSQAQAGLVAGSFVDLQVPTGPVRGELATNSITYTIHDVYYVHCTTVPPPPPPDEPRSSKHDTARGSRADTTKVRHQAERSALRPGHEAMIRREGFLSPPPTGHEPASGIVESSATTNRQHHGAGRRRYRGISVRHLCHLFVQPAVHRIFSSPAISSEPAQETMQEKAGS
ncbi:hypothetical protein ACCO45_010484 [Purpureocillium lilacinum]|uniref:Uncharacterized protein n=1 Tax=Purpureocillium lilacinum TaxID=33203 RepID=A0ACC4DFB3_PURLI